MALAERQKINLTTPLAELPLTDRLIAFRARNKETDQAKRDLFKQGEDALADGLAKLTRGATGTEVTVSSGLNQTTTFVRQQLVLPKDNIRYDYEIPEELRILIRDIRLKEYKRTPAEVWSDTLRSDYAFDVLILGGRVEDENFQLRMKYLGPSTYYLDPARRDDQIVSFSGNYTNGFERELDGIKDLNRSDAFTKLGFALGLVKFVSDARTSSPKI